MDVFFITYNLFNVQDKECIVVFSHFIYKIQQSWNNKMPKKI